MPSRRLTWSPAPAPTHPPQPPWLQEITPEKALEILKRIPDDDCRALGFDPRYSRPDSMVLTVLPVPPPPVRPSVQMDSSSRWVGVGARPDGRGVQGCGVYERVDGLQLAVGGGGGAA